MLSNIEASIRNRRNIEVEQALQQQRGHIFSEAERELHQREVRSERLQRQWEERISQAKSELRQYHSEVTVVEPQRNEMC